MKYLILIFLLIVYGGSYGDLTKAYGLYLTGEFDSAFTYYRAEYELNSENLDAVYGMINCHIAKQEYDAALNLALDIVKKNQNSILYAKLIYIYARKNDRRKTFQTYESAVKIVPVTSLNDTSDSSTEGLADIIYAAGWGFYDTHNFHEALQWFSKGDSLFREMPLFQQAIQNTKIALKNRIVCSVAADGGILAYSPDSDYESGTFVTGSLSFLFNQLYKAKVMFSRTDIRFKPLYYGIRYYTLYASRDGDPEASGNIVISFKEFDNIDGEKDTMYFTYTEILTSRSATSFDTIVTFIPTEYHQNDIYLSLKEYGSFLNRTALTAGCRLSFTNMRYANHLNTFFVKHVTNIARVSFGCAYYASFLDEDRIFQVSPQLEFSKGPIFTGFTVNAISPASGKHKAQLVDKYQLSSDVWAGLKSKSLKVTVTGMYGDKRFLNGAEAEFMHNVLYPYRFGIKSLIEWTPRNKWLTVYHLFDYANYKTTQKKENGSHTFGKYVIMGGVYIQW